MPSDYDGSFINSTDEYDSPGIGQALAKLDINPAEFPAGATILVTYADGSKAVFVKGLATDTYQWTWDHLHAWNSAGKPINRSGQLVDNPNSSGSGGGSVEAAANQDQTDAATLWALLNLEDCVEKTTYSYDGEDIGTIYNWIPCF